MTTSKPGAFAPNIIKRKRRKENVKSRTIRKKKKSSSMYDSAGTVRCAFMGDAAEKLCGKCSL